MKKLLLTLIFTLTSLSMAEYAIGEVCENVSFTTEDGLETSIYDQVDQGKAVMLFYGQTW